MLTFINYRKFKRYPCFLQMVLFSLPALLVVFSLFTRSMSWAGTMGWKSPTTTWRPVEEAFSRAHGTLYQQGSGERTIRCIHQVVSRCHTCWRATLNLTTFKTSSMAPQGFHWPSSEPYCPFCPSLPPNSFDAGLFLLEIKPHDWWLGSMPVGKSLQITFEMSPNIWNG